MMIGSPIGNLNSQSGIASRPIGGRRIAGTHEYDPQAAYEEKWEYVRNNPVRAGLAARAEDWPFQGVIHELMWA